MLGLLAHDPISECFDRENFIVDLARTTPTRPTPSCEAPPASAVVAHALKIFRLFEFSFYPHHPTVSRVLRRFVFSVLFIRVVTSLLPQIRSVVDGIRRCARP